MRTPSSSLKVLVCALFVMALSSIAQAQATRTWVSGVGDDANPCSRTAPCKTFAGAISKTFIGGEISVLDPGGYGAVTIVKSILIDGGGSLGSILANNGSTGVIINIAANANDPHRKVVLRRLTINGTGSSGSIGTNTGTRGVSVQSNGLSQLYVENSYIQNFSTTGILVDFAAPATGTRVSIKDTNISNIVGAASNNNGIELNASSAGGFISGVIDNVRVEATATAINLRNRTHMAVRNTVMQNCSTAGAAINSPANSATLSLESSYIMSCNVGVQAGTAPGTVVDLSNTTIMGNSTAIANGATAGTLNSHGNNRIFSNSSPGTTPMIVPEQ